MRRARVDANQAEIVAHFRDHGFSVAHTHTVGSGFPDIAISRNGKTKLVEIKDGSKPPSARALTNEEVIFHDTWRDEIYLVKDKDDVDLISKFW